MRLHYLVLFFFTTQLVFAEGEWKLLKGRERIEFAEREIKYLENHDLKKAQELSESALKIAFNESDSSLMAWSYHSLARQNRYLSNYQAAEQYAKKSIVLAEKFAEERLPEYTIELGSSHMQKGALLEAMQEFIKSLSLAESMNNNAQTGHALYKIGFVFNIRDNFDTALAYFNKSVKIFESLEDNPMGIAQGLNGIGLIYMRKSNYDESRAVFLQTIKILEPLDEPRMLAKVYNNIGITYEDQEYFEKSIEYYSKSLNIKRKLNDKRGMASTYGNLADNYRQEKKYDLAIKYNEYALKLAKATQSFTYEISDYKRFYLIYEETDRFEDALYYMELYKFMDDSLTNQKNLAHVNELLALYEVAKKEKENASLRLEAGLIENELFRQRVISIGSITIIFLLVLLIWWRFQVYSKYKKLSESLKLQKSQLEGLNQTLEQVLDENKNLSNILIHDLRSPINKVLALNDMIKEKGGLNPDQIKYVGLIKNQLELGRKIIGDLLFLENSESSSKEFIELNDFFATLIQSYEGQAKEKAIEIILLRSAKEVYLFENKTQTLRIFDNLISNAIKFSAMEKKIEIKIFQENNYASVYIRDEGPGFTAEDEKLLFRKFARLSARPTNNEASTGLGLAIVKRLLTQMGGEIQLLHEKGHGAVFKIKIPLADKQPAKHN